jgi:hypothetical protein
MRNKFFGWMFAVACLFAACTSIQLVAATITLNWTDNSTNEAGFKIEKSIGGAAFVEVGVVNTDVKTFVDNSVFVSGVEYSYRVRAFNVAGNSGYSNTASLIWPSIPASPGVLLIIISE